MWRKNQKILDIYIELCIDILGREVKRGFRLPKRILLHTVPS